MGNLPPFHWKEEFPRKTEQPRGFGFRKGTCCYRYQAVGPLVACYTFCSGAEAYMYKGLT